MFKQTAKLINFSSLPTKEYVLDNIDLFRKLNNEGKITVYDDDGVWKAHEFLFELSLKQFK